MYDMRGGWKCRIFRKCLHDGYNEHTEKWETFTKRLQRKYRKIGKRLLNGYNENTEKLGNVY